MEKKMNLSAQNNKPISQDFIATVVLASKLLTSEWGMTQEKDPACNPMRMSEMKQVIQTILAQTSHDGVIVFPGGWFHSGEEPAEALDSWLITEISEILRNNPHTIVVAFGVDGLFDRPKDEDPYDKDQIALAINKDGIVAKGRKFFPGNDEGPIIHYTRNYLDTESGKPRIFELNGVKYYLLECNDIKAPYTERAIYPNPGVDIALNLIHRVYEKGGSRNLTQENNFPCIFGARSSAVWQVPVFMTAIFFRPSLPEDWPTGVYCIEERPHRTGYGEISIPHTTLKRIELREGYAIVHMFENVARISQEKEPPLPSSPVREVVYKKPVMEKKMERKKSAPNQASLSSRQEFQDLVNLFLEKYLPSGMVVKLNLKGQFRITYPQWHVVEGSPKKYIFYEFDDWISRNRDEFSAEIQFGMPYFEKNAEIVFKEIENRENFAPDARTEFDRISTRGWYRLKIIYPSSMKPDLICQMMVELINNTKDLVEESLNKTGN